MSGLSPAFDPVQASVARYAGREKYAYGKIGEGADWAKTLHCAQMI